MNSPARRSALGLLAGMDTPQWKPGRVPDDAPSHFVVKVTLSGAVPFWMGSWGGNDPGLHVDRARAHVYQPGDECAAWSADGVLSWLCELVPVPAVEDTPLPPPWRTNDMITDDTLRHSHLLPHAWENDTRLVVMARDMHPESSRRGELVYAGTPATFDSIDPQRSSVAVHPIDQTVKRDGRFVVNREPYTFATDSGELVGWYVRDVMGGFNRDQVEVLEQATEWERAWAQFIGAPDAEKALASGSIAAHHIAGRVLHAQQILRDLDRLGFSETRRLAIREELAKALGDELLVATT